MADRPIIFSGPMVQALIAGRKTQTRRNIWKPAALDALAVFGANFLTLPGNIDLIGYAPGDRLYVREAFCPRLGYPAPIAKPHYRADDDKPEWRGLWKPSIHMPRWASRLTLTVTDVRVQRLNEISNDDAIAEGIKPHGHAFTGYGKQADVWMAPYDSFASLWNSLHGPDAWAANPFVVALTFTVEHRNIDAGGGNG